jgi:hypothetical protein
MNRIRAEIVMIVVATIFVVLGGVFSLAQMRAVHEHLQKHRDFMEERDKMYLPLIEDLRVRIDRLMTELQKIEARPMK